MRNIELHIILISPPLIIALHAMDWSFTYTVGESAFTDEYVLQKKEADHSGDFLFKNTRNSKFCAMNCFSKMYLLV